MGDLARRALAEHDRVRIAKVCRPCDLFLLETSECRALVHAAQIFLKILEERRCDPRKFLERFLYRHLYRRFGPQHAERAEDIASRIVVELLERPPTGPFPSDDLIGLRRFLASRGVQRVVDERREVEGRMRCGNCLHHRHVAGQGRRCHHPDPDHFWSSKEVKASENPREFDPPCYRYTIHRAHESVPEDAAEPAAPGGADPMSRLLQSESSRLLLESLMSVQKKDPRVALVLYLDFFQNKPNADIARELNATVRTVTRYKQRGLEMLQEELERRGIHGSADLEIGAA